MAGQTVEVALSDPGPSAIFPIPADIVPFVDSVYAEIDNGAGSDATPTLEIRGPNGDTVAAVPQDDVVPGGDTGRATWALRLPGKRGRPTTGTVVAFAQGYSDFAGGDAVQTVPTHAARSGRHDHTSTTDSSVMSWRTSGVTNDTLDFHAVGTYLLWATSLWEVTDAALTSSIMSSGVAGFRHDPFLPSGQSSFVPTDGLANSEDFDVFHITTSNVSSTVLHQNGLGTDKAVDAQFFTAVYLATG